MTTDTFVFINRVCYTESRRGNSKDHGSNYCLVISCYHGNIEHRASKGDILKHYDSYIQDQVAAGRIRYFPECQYNFDSNRIKDTDDDDDDQKNDNGKIHSFSSLDGTKQYSIKVRTKFVNGTLGECIIPSKSPVSFPVDEYIHLMTPNAIFDGHHNKTLHYNDKHFVVLGCGKTAMDTVNYLQRDMKLHPENISWIIPSDVWMVSRDGGGNPWVWPQAVLEHGGNKHEAAMALEKEGSFVRLDKDVEPTKFRFPLIGNDELKYMRRVNSVIRRGRVSAIRQGDDGKVVIKFGADQQDWIPDMDRKDLMFVHCTSPGPYNGKEKADLFVSDDQLNLDMLFIPPVPISMSVLAHLESNRIHGKLDLEFGKRLVQSLREEEDSNEQEQDGLKENEILKRLVKAIDLKPTDGGLPDKPAFQSLLNFALALALFDEDAMVGYKWFKSNRLAFLSIPGFKCGINETLGLMSKHADKLGYSKQTSRMIDLLRTKLQVLEGK